MEKRMAERMKGGKTGQDGSRPFHGFLSARFSLSIFLPPVEQ